MTLYIGNKNITERFFLDIRQNSLPTAEFGQYMSKSLTSFVAPNSIVKLRDYCFNGFTSLTSVKISTSIKELGEYCFKGCTGLQKVWLPLSCIKIPENAFEGVPSTCTIYTNSLIDVKSWESGWNGNATVLYDKSEIDFNNG
jgi:hypothetical protein